MATHDRALGINGFGRIGKLTVWNQISAKHFDHLVVNLGREVGRSIDDLVHYLERDSTYGRLGSFLHGFGHEASVEIVDREGYEMSVDGTRLTFLTKERNPGAIPWKRHGVKVVIDATGRFLDPTLPADTGGGSLRGHLEAGARVVINSAAFKIGDRRAVMPEDAVVLIHGVNHQAFDPSKHAIVSAASCTTTALAHMMVPLLENELTKRMLTASMSTIHACTNNQAVLDRAPAAGATDLRRSRSILNNIILTSTNAARALEQVIPEIGRIGFLADSVRVPIPTASVIILNATFQSRLDGKGECSLNRDAINTIYQDYSLGKGSGVKFSEGQNVSMDIVGEPSAVVIEGHETHTRTGFIDVEVDPEGVSVEIPVTHIKLFGWYDNELGSYSRRMNELTDYIGQRVG